jgi:hypothetical protein
MSGMSNRWRNRKNGLVYVVLKEHVSNATNSRDGEIMVLYHTLGRDTELYVREKGEFLDKFVPCE